MLQFASSPPSCNHRGAFCPLRGWLDEYSAWRAMWAGREDPDSDIVIIAGDAIAPFEAAIYVGWNNA